MIDYNEGVIGFNFNEKMINGFIWICMIFFLKKRLCVIIKIDLDLCFDWG